MTEILKDCFPTRNAEGVCDAPGERSGPVPRVIERAVYRGPHRYSATPMVRVRLDLGRLEDWPSHRLPGFNDALLEQLPGLGDHGCCFGVSGGFVRRLTEGTWFGHIVEHVALELQYRAGHEVSRGKTRSVSGQPGVYDIMFAYCDHEVALRAARLALQICNGILPPDLREDIENLDQVIDADGVIETIHTAAPAIGYLASAVERNRLGPSTQALVDEAVRRGIPVERLNNQSLIRLGWGSRQRLIRASVTQNTALIATDLAGDKSMTKAMLHDIGCPVAEGMVVSSEFEACKAAAELGGLVVVKPLDGNHGRGVTTGLSSHAEVATAYQRAVRHGSSVIVERQLAGRDYRLLVVDGQLVAAAERCHAAVTGDGQSTVAQLIHALNRDPRRGEGHEKVMTRISTEDPSVIACLHRQGLQLDSIPLCGTEVQLHPAANLSSGGYAIDCTDQVHPDNAAIACRAARALGLDVAGIDVMAPDISRSIYKTGGGVVEVNAAPGLRMHIAPAQGQSRNVAAPIIDALFQDSNGRIPVVGITGTNGKTTVGRMVAHVLAHAGRTCGLTNTSGVYIDGRRIWAGDASGPSSARMVLKDPTVEVAVLETARGGLLREGLAYDRCDVGCVLNVQPDHLGLKGINTIEELAEVKAVVAEAVRPGGICVLNADDPHTVRMAADTRGQVIWFSMQGKTEVVRSHLATGGTAVIYHAETCTIWLVSGAETLAIFRAAEIPATLNAQAEFNIANAMAAIAILHGLGVESVHIQEGLYRFTSSFEDNPGRLNIHTGYGFTVVLDYAHNPHGLRALAKVVKGMGSSGRIIGTVSIPGDRRDADLEEMGRIAAESFDHIIFREAPDNRGRPVGEVNRLLSKGALNAGCSPCRIRCIVEEAEAMAACLAAAAPGDVVVLTPTSVEATWRQVLSFRPRVPGNSVDGGPDTVIEHHA